MKSQHRHELQTNELGLLVERFTNWYEENSSRLLVGVLIVAAAIAVGVYVTRSSYARRAEAWAAFAACRSSEEYANVADDFEGTAVGAWARLNAGEGQLQQGIQLMFRDRAAGVAELKEAETRLKGLVDDSGTPKEVRERALIALARLRETASDGDLQPAIALYKQFLTEFPKSVLRATAEQRVDALEAGRSQEFYAWFHKQNPKPADLEKPSDLKESSSEAPATDETKESAETAADKDGPKFPEAPKSAKEPAEGAQTKAPMDAGDTLKEEVKPAEKPEKKVEQGDKPKAKPQEAPKDQPKEEPSDKKTSAESDKTPPAQK